MDIATIKKDLENQIGDINKELKNIYLPLEAVLILLGKRTAFQIALGLIDSLQKEQSQVADASKMEPEVDLEKEIDKEWENCGPIDEGMGYESALLISEQFHQIVRHFYELGKKRKKEMNQYCCLYCKYYEPTINGSEDTEPEGICGNQHRALGLVYGHECCKDYNAREEDK